MIGPLYVVIREGTGDGDMPTFVLGVFTEEEQAEAVRAAYDGQHGTLLFQVPKLDEVVQQTDARFWGFN